MDLPSAVAREIERSKPAGETDDPMEIVEEAQEIVRVRSLLSIRLTGAREKYRTIEMDPMNVGAMLDIKLKKRHDMDVKGTNPATPGQLAFLRDLGIAKPEGISFYGASKLLDKLCKRKKEGMASVPQVRALLAAGVDPLIARSLSRNAALQSIIDIDRANKFLPATQKELF